MKKQSLISIVSELKLALARACGDSCYCALRSNLKLKGKCWACDGRELLKRTADIK
jgi:hypothetical protein